MKIPTIKLSKQVNAIKNHKITGASNSMKEGFVKVGNNVTSITLRKMCH